MRIGHHAHFVEHIRRAPLFSKRLGTMSSNRRITTRAGGSVRGARCAATTNETLAPALIGLSSTLMVHLITVNIPALAFQRRDLDQRTHGGISGSAATCEVDRVRDVRVLTSFGLNRDE